MKMSREHLTWICKELANEHPAVSGEVKAIRDLALSALDREMTDTVQVPELLPCPFCGNSEIKLSGNGIGDFCCECQKCSARTSDVRCETKRLATERWNTRSAPPQQPSEPEWDAAIEDRRSDRQIVFDWLMQDKGYWGTSEEVARVDELLRALRRQPSKERSEG